MRNVVFVTYDIRDRRRLRSVYRFMRGRGEHIQLSVFRCELSPRERVELIAALFPLLDHSADQVLLIDVGPVECRGDEMVQAIGRPLIAIERRATII
jgi:CRISPR-associated protein Cas2